MLTVFGRASFQRLNICPASENIPDCLLSHFYRFLKFFLLRRFSTSACSRFSSIDAPFDEHMTASGGSILAYPPVAEASAFRLINHRREELFMLSSARDSARSSRRWRIRTIRLGVDELLRNRINTTAVGFETRNQSVDWLLIEFYWEPQYHSIEQRTKSPVGPLFKLTCEAPAVCF